MPLLIGHLWGKLLPFPSNCIVRVRFPSWITAHNARWFLGPMLVVAPRVQVTSLVLSKFRFCISSCTCVSFGFCVSAWSHSRMLYPEILRLQMCMCTHTQTRTCTHRCFYYFASLSIHKTNIQGEWNLWRACKGTGAKKQQPCIGFSRLLHWRVPLGSNQMECLKALPAFWWLVSTAVHPSIFIPRT